MEESFTERNHKAYRDGKLVSFWFLRSDLHNDIFTIVDGKAYRNGKRYPVYRLNFHLRLRKRIAARIAFERNYRPQGYDGYAIYKEKWQ